VIDERRVELLLLRENRLDQLPDERRGFLAPAGRQLGTRAKNFPALVEA